MARTANRKRRLTAWVYDAVSFEDAFEPLKRRYPEHEWDIRSVSKLDGNLVTLLSREMNAPWTSLCVFPLRSRELNAFLRHGWLRCLDAAFPPRARSRFALGALDLGSRNGSLFALPEDVTPYSLMVRTDVLQRNRFQPPATWAELERQLNWFAVHDRGQLLRAQEGGPTHRYGFFVSLLGSNGVDVGGGLERIVQDRTRLLQAYGWAQRLCAQRLLNYPADLYPEKNATMDQFREGRFAYVFGWPSMLKSFPYHLLTKIRILPFPRGPSAEAPVSAMYGSLWCVPHNTASLDVALEVLQAITAPEFTLKLERAGGAAFPAQKEIWHDAVVLEKKLFYRDAAGSMRGLRAHAPDFYDPDLRRLEETFCGALADGVSGEEWLKRLMSESHKLALRSVADEIVRKATVYIEENLAEIHSVMQVAESVKRNPDYVNRLFQRELNQSCRAYLAKRRIERAKDLLGDVTLSFKEIAARIGVGSATSFSRLCQQHWGCSAVQMRRRELARIRGELPR
ncbi:MAG: extracellular solute-binding protein [Planctomycetes bacterium]|nr:extracellular solute-binding protein [Planctomycetota bacterium]